ncbi:Hypothetical protein CAP_5381 [Chondromyces apiculatus DSM 436]|uniref:Uncharacterized protein n=1 Tax=Chondromyces apiculatus DSM 436 TaxID=1192034 RepID=A0A017T467_9BACT|nr:Hypothetical protein CAP_5381 [Chondromyces apiculatus DSM 436]
MRRGPRICAEDMRPAYPTQGPSVPPLPLVGTAYPESGASRPLRSRWSLPPWRCMSAKTRTWDEGERPLAGSHGPPFCLRRAPSSGPPASCLLRDPPSTLCFPRFPDRHPPLASLSRRGSAWNNAGRSPTGAVRAGTRPVGLRPRQGPSRNKTDRPPTHPFPRPQRSWGPPRRAWPLPVRGLPVPPRRGFRSGPRSQMRGSLSLPPGDRLCPPRERSQAPVRRPQALVRRAPALGERTLALGERTPALGERTPALVRCAPALARRGDDAGQRGAQRPALVRCAPALARRTPALVQSVQAPGWTRPNSASHPSCAFHPSKPPPTASPLSLLLPPSPRLPAFSPPPLLAALSACQRRPSTQTWT